MRVVIAGTRVDAPLDRLVAIVDEAVKLSGFNIGMGCSVGSVIDTVISGEAKGIDTAGEAWAARKSIPTLCMPARFKYGPTAALVRNECMLDIADAVIVIWDGNSRGSAHILDAARTRGLKTFEMKVVQW